MNLAFQMQLVLFSFCGLLAFPAQATVVTSHTLNVATQAGIGTGSDQDNVTAGADSGSLGSLFSTGIGQSSSQINWNWANSTLTSMGNFVSDRTSPSGPPEDFSNAGLLQLQFTLGQSASYSLNGTWGFTSVMDGNDSLTVRLLDSGGGVLFTDSHTTPDSGAFLSSGTLTAGDYTFELEVNLVERIQSRDLRSAVWDLASFNLQPISSTPEPGTLGSSILILLACARSRSRRPRHA